MTQPDGGELWRHKASGDHYIIKSTYIINPIANLDDLVIVITIRLRDQYKIEEPLGMFLWEWERLN